MMDVGMASPAYQEVQAAWTPVSEVVSGQICGGTDSLLPRRTQWL